MKKGDWYLNHNGPEYAMEVIGINHDKVNINFYLNGKNLPEGQSGFFSLLDFEKDLETGEISLMNESETAKYLLVRS